MILSATVHSSAEWLTYVSGMIALGLAALTGAIKLFQSASDLAQYPIAKRFLDVTAVITGAFALIAAGPGLAKNIKLGDTPLSPCLALLASVVIVLVAAACVLGFMRLDNFKRSKQQQQHSDCTCACSDCQPPAHPVSGCGCKCSRCKSLHANGLNRHIAGVKNPAPVPEGTVELRLSASLRGAGFRFGELAGWERSKDKTRTWMIDPESLEAGESFRAPEFVRVDEDPTGDPEGSSAHHVAIQREAPSAQSH